MDSPQTHLPVSGSKMLAPKNVVVYSGTFDPITYGHIDIIKRAAALFPEVVIAVAKNPALSKSPLFSLEDRLEMIAHIFSADKNIKALAFEGLLANFMIDIHASTIIRGIRNTADFENEYQMAHVNQSIGKHAGHTIETIFLPPSEGTRFISSSMIKEVYRLGANVAHWVHPYVLQRLNDQHQ